MNHHYLRLAVLFLIGVILLPFSLYAQTPTQAPTKNNYGPNDKSAQTELNFIPWLLPEIDILSWRVAMGKVRNRIETFNDKKFNGIAYNGMVGGDLLRDELQAALVDSYRIDNNYYLAKALFSIAKYLEKNNDRQAALDLLEEVVLSFHGQIHSKTEDENPIDLSNLIYDVAMLLLTLDKADSAMELISNIPDDKVKSKALREATERAIDISKESQEAAATNSNKLQVEQKKAQALAAIHATIEFAKALPYQHNSIGYTMIDMIDSLIILKDDQFALSELNNLLPKTMAGPEEGRDEIIAKIAALYMRLNQAKQAMELLRGIKAPLIYAETLASVASARFEVGDVDAMTPLFILSRDAIDTIQTGTEKAKARSHLIIELTRVGRLADAFVEAGKIVDSRAQALALNDMANFLLEKKNFTAVEKLLDYIQPWSLRVAILGALAKNQASIGNQAKATEFLMKGLDIGNTPLTSPLIPRQVGSILNFQLRYGDQIKDKEILAKARDIIEKMPNQLIKIDGLVRLAISEANLEQMEEARQSLTSAYRLTFDNTQNPAFAKALETVSYGMLMTGDLLSAFDAAARIPPAPTEAEVKEMQRRLRRQISLEYELPKPVDPENPMADPQYAALARIAAVAARIGEMEIAMRSADMIGLTGGKAIAYGAIGTGLGSQKQTMMEMMDDVANVTGLNVDVWLSPTAANLVERDWLESERQKAEITNTPPATQGANQAPAADAPKSP